MPCNCDHMEITSRESYNKRKAELLDWYESRMKIHPDDWITVWPSGAISGANPHAKGAHPTLLEALEAAKKVIDNAKRAK